MSQIQTYPFLLPPNNFDAKLHVAGIFCDHAGEVLLLKRADGCSQAGTWGLPAGKIEAGEELANGACRELFEEAGIQLDPNIVHYKFKIYCRQPGLDFIFHAFACKLREKPVVSLNLREHSEFGWFNFEQAMAKKLINGGQMVMESYFLAG